MKNSLKEHLPLMIIAALYMIGNDILSIYVSTQHPEFDYYFLTTILMFIIQFYISAGICSAVFLLVSFLVYAVKNYRTKPFWENLGVAFKQRYLTKQQIYGFIIIFLFIPLFFAFIVMYKQLIPFINPFSWDKTFMQWDYVLHFHHHPWQLLQPVFGYPIITAILSKIYGLWFIMLAGIILWQASSQKRFYRTQFFLTFALSWVILGTLCAYYFSSAGPCFYRVFSHDVSDPYAPLMSYLQLNAPAWVINLQASLLSHLEDNTLIFGGGVSAMPSMHISMATLCFLICSKTSKWLGSLAFIFLIVIFIGSIQLAWHYAVDGYVSFIITLLIWYGTGKMLSYAPEGFFTEETGIIQEAI